MNAITSSSPADFFTKAYGAFRWNEYLTTRSAPWYLVTLGAEFDQMRHVENINIPCTTDDFGNLVRVPA